MSKGVALVTGASRGVGRALAVGFLKDGYRVVAMARSIEKLRSLATEAHVDESELFCTTVEMGDEHSIVAAVKSIPSDFGPLKVVVNNAAEGGAGSLEIPFSKFQSMINVNLSGPFRLLQEVVPTLIKNRDAMVINISSRAGKIGFPGWAAYGASKFGLSGMTESLHHELRGQGVKVTTICPGWVNTDMARESGSPVDPRNMIQPEDIMKTVRWLLSLSHGACVPEVAIECCFDTD